MVNTPFSTAEKGMFHNYPFIIYRMGLVFYLLNIPFVNLYAGNGVFNTDTETAANHKDTPPLCVVAYI